MPKVLSSPWLLFLQNFNAVCMYSSGWIHIYSCTNELQTYACYALFLIMDNLPHLPTGSRLQNASWNWFHHFCKCRLAIYVSLCTQKFLHILKCVGFIILFIFVKFIYSVVIWGLGYPLEKWIFYCACNLLTFLVLELLKYCGKDVSVTVRKMFVLQILWRVWCQKPMNWEVLLWWLIELHLRQEFL